MSYINNITNILLNSSLSVKHFDEILINSNTFFNNIELEKELIISNGFPIHIGEFDVYLKTNNTLLHDQVFCVVDIETTASNTKDGQIIEIGAVKIKNNKVLESYKSLVTANHIPKKVQEITGITMDMLKDARNLKDVLEEFKIFLEDDVFVAHNISFDYKFINDSFKKYSLGELFNRKLCTIDLAKKTIVAKRYGLKYLKEDLNINIGTHHRAYDDALSTVSILKKSLENVPEYIHYVEQLIEFSLEKDSNGK